MKLLGRISSINVRKVLWTAAEIGLDIDHDDRWATSEWPTSRPEFLALNPHGLVPVRQDESGTLWESNTICRYLPVIALSAIARSSLAVAAFTAALLGTGPAAAQVQPVVPEVAAQYVRPHELIDIGGRRLNLFCMGTGAKTVLFDAGGSDWSVVWALVQPAVAQNARACSYDRAGLGYSDAAKGSRSPILIVEDLHALIQAAKLATPLILVGHSLGGFNMKLYAALYPEDVAGLVLLDPAEDRTDARTRDTMRRRLGVATAVRSSLLDDAGLQRAISHSADCAAAAREKLLDPASQLYRSCTDPVRPALGPAIATERARIQVSAAYQQAQASELANSVYGDPTHDEDYAALFRPGLLGNRPLILLSHGNHDASDPVDAADFEATLAMQCETVALSRRGALRVVENSDHNIELDRPDAVIRAITDVLAATEAGPSAKARPSGMGCPVPKSGTQVANGPRP